MDLEEMFISIGILFGIIPLVGILLGYLKLFYFPVTFLCILLITGLFLFPLVKKDPIKLKISVHFILVLIVAIAFFVMMYKGAMGQPWLEDDDPYGYAMDSMFVAEEHTTMKPEGVMKGDYLEPDPPGYSVFMAFFYQLIGNMNWTLKFVNVLLLSLGIIFAYLFFKEFMKNGYKALFATLVIAAIPSFLTRFIFATSLAATLFFPALYCIERSKEHKIWVVMAALFIANIFVTHLLVSFAFICFFIIYLLFNRKLNVFLCGLCGMLFSLIFWLPNIIRFGIKDLIGRIGSGESITAIVGSATRAYTVSDFFSAPSQNMINTSTGWGPVIFLLVLFALGIIIYKYKDLLKESYIKTALLWLILALVAVNAYRLPFMLMPFRWWTFLAIPVAVLSAEGLYFIFRKEGYGIPLAVILIIGIIFTSWYPKYQINAHPWNPSASLLYPGLMEGHLWLMENLPMNTPVYSFNQGPKLPGFNIWFCSWCKEDMDMENRFLNITPDETAGFMKRKGYGYLIFNSWYFDRFDYNVTIDKFNEFFSSGLFVSVYQNEGMIVLEVRK